MSQEPPPNQGKPRWSDKGLVLFVLGLWILVPSGLCTVYLGGSAVGSLYSQDSQESRFTWAILQAVLLFGGVPMALGAALVYAGLKFRRRD